MIYPEPFEFENIESYFDSFLDMNKGNPNFSHRLFAKSIKWPISLCLDVAKSRKRMTIQRLLEFCSFAGFGTLRTEKLIYLLVNEHLSASVKDRFFNQLIDSKYKVEKYPERENAHTMLKSMILKIVRSLRFKPTVENLSKCIENRSYSNEEIVKCLDAIDLASMDDLDRGLRSDLNHTETSELHYEFSNNYSYFCQYPVDPATCNSGFVALSNTEFKMVEDEIIKLRNIVVSMSQSNLKEVNEPAQNVELFQLDLNLFRVTNLSKLKKGLS